MQRPLVRDPRIGELLTAKEPLSSKAPAPYLRAFAWVANEDVPKVLQPLLKAYLDYTAKVLRDPRDVIFVSHILACLLTVGPSAVWMLSGFSWLKLVVHAVLVGAQATPFVLMLHCVAHRPLFRKDLAHWDGLVHYVLAPFFGHTWNSFYLHHVRHHHVEDNGPKDLSSTMRYQRDSVWDFVCYFSRFFFFSWIELPLYFFNQGKLFYAALNFVSEISFFSFYALGLKNAPSPAGFFCVFLLPFILVRFGMMSGNWAQHAFVDASDPTNNYRSSITCIEVPYNAIAFNDGYHTSHHLNSIRHWQDHPEYIAKNRDKFKAEKAIIFQGIDFHQTWLFLMMKDYSSLAKHLLQLTHPGEPGHLSEEEIILFLKSRTRAMTRKEIEAGYPSLKKKL